jgi:hypothetical protein
VEKILIPKKEPIDGEEVSYVERPSSEDEDGMEVEKENSQSMELETKTLKSTKKKKVLANSELQKVLHERKSAST